MSFADSWKKMMISLEGFESSGGVTVVGGDSFPRLVVGVGFSSIGFDVVMAGVTSLLGTEAILAVGSILIEIRDGKQNHNGQSVGRVKLEPIHDSWTELSGLRDLGLGHRPARQIVPIEHRHMTNDVPVMSVPWDLDDPGAWRCLSEDDIWPYSFDSDTTVVTNLAALIGSPITEVARWEDGDFQMFAIGDDGQQPEESDIRVVPLLTLVSADATLLSLASTPPGRSWWRENAEHPWMHWRGWEPDEKTGLSL